MACCAQSFSAFAALCTKASGKASREGPELSHLEQGCLRCEFEGLNDWTTAANGFSLFREYIEKLLVMVEMRCHFRLFQLFPTGRQTVLVKARVVFKMARLRWRGRERERKTDANAGLCLSGGSFNWPLELCPWPTRGHSGSYPQKCVFRRSVFQCFTSTCCDQMNDGAHLSPPWCFARAARTNVFGLGSSHVL